MTHLILSLLVLALGPLTYRLLRNREETLAILDGFVVVTISALVVLCILPAALNNGGAFGVVALMAAGWLGPTLTERIFDKQGRQAHAATLVLGMTGLCIHAITDGAALTVKGLEYSQGAEHVPLAIVLHRFPVAVTLWWLLRPIYGVVVASAVMILVGAGTVTGYFAGSYLAPGLTSAAMAYFLALIAGTLLHVVFHRPHLKKSSCCSGDARARVNRFEGAGGICGLLLTLALFTHEMESHHGVHDQGPLSDVLNTFVRLTLESAPALALGYLLAGLLNAFLPPSSAEWLRGRTRWGQAVRGVGMGLPMPICSCGVVPVYRTLVQRGAPASAALAFLVATPELGLESIFLSFPLLGSEMAVLRIAAAAILALVVGVIVGAFADRRREGGTVAEDKPDESRETTAAAPAGDRIRRSLRNAFHVGFCEMVDHTAPWIVLGLVTASVAKPLLTANLLAGIPGGLDVVLFALLGIPTYVCATGATPLVAILLLKGVSPGAALALLLTGPATNVTTFGVIGKLHSPRVALVFSVTMFAFSVGVGYAANALIGSVEPPVQARLHERGASVLQLTCAALLAAAVAYSLYRRGPRRFAREIWFSDDTPAPAHEH